MAEVDFVLQSSDCQVRVQINEDFGPLRGFNSASHQQHQLFRVFDFKGKPWTVEGGAGVCLTGSTDRFVLRFILSRVFHQM